MSPIALLAVAAVAALAWSRRTGTSPAARRAPLSDAERQTLYDSIVAATEYQQLVYLSQWAAYYGATDLAVLAQTRAMQIGPPAPTSVPA